MDTICIDACLITVEANWVAQVFIFSETFPLTTEYLWYNELLEVSNLNLTIQVTHGYKYKDLEQV